ncbi:serine/threonine-protein kinase RsbT [Tropicimonas isoalkanivorans]|uniref:Serine/threonine-protein kinase RsbT n=2 Tax=Tropicimonas isoalkanivorans TaxID=441112 RepID=A0A1I1Q9J9_9RHOB|nr:serine/threonine-protein kinase RsbT [Tropicimonas isoalkanivorans]
MREMKSRRASALRMTRFATAVSEIARNAVVHGGGGEISVSITADEQYLVVRCQDHGPGIGNLEQAMQDGYTSRDGLGRGLGGAKRLSDTFDIRSAPGEGTVVTMSCRV